VVTQGTCGNVPGNNRTDTFGFEDASVSGTTAAISLNTSTNNGRQPPDVWTMFFTFTGALNGTELAGTLTIAQEIGGPAGTPQNSRGSIIHSIALR
jgi:hypothetical protein